MPIDEGTNKTTTGRKNINDNVDNFRFLELGEVVSINDPNYLGRIKVRIKGPRARGGDDGIDDSDLPWCFPMIPKLISIQPKPKEAVFVFIFGRDNQHIDRMYIGPINSQPQNLEFDPFYLSALAGFSFGSELPKTSVSTIPQLNGVFPDQSDISIQGRYNTDITQKNNEIIIRAGKFVPVTPSSNNPFPFTFNSKTQAYIQIKNDVVVIPQTDIQKEERGSVINHVANKINLLTHKNGVPNFNLTNQTNLISDDELATILEGAHQLPFGDIVLEYFRLMKDAIFNHVHNGSGNVATDLIGDGNKQSIAVFKAKADDLEKQMLSKNIRIN